MGLIIKNQCRFSDSFWIFDVRIHQKYEFYSTGNSVPAFELLNVRFFSLSLLFLIVEMGEKNESSYFWNYSPK